MTARIFLTIQHLRRPPSRTGVPLRRTLLMCGCSKLSTSVSYFQASNSPQRLLARGTASPNSLVSKIIEPQPGGKPWAAGQAWTRARGFFRIRFTAVNPASRSGLDMSDGLFPAYVYRGKHWGRGQVWVSGDFFRIRFTAVNRLGHR